jgi:glycosyltransferase involved in cell wall biosynthesis
MEKSNSPLVSILTPVYNGKRYLSECIESVLSQSYSNWEYVIVNNQSTDGSDQLVEAYAAQDNRITVHHNEHFLGMADNWNLSVQKISQESKYLKIIHADDWIFPECIETMVSLAENNKSVGIVTSYIQEGNYVEGDGLPFPSNVLGGKKVCRDTLMGDIPYLFGSPSALLLRTDLVFARRRLYNSNFKQLLDQSACFDLLTESDLGFVHQVLTFHRIHENSQTAENELVSRLFPEQIQFLKEFGPIFLTKDELNQRISIRLSRYYQFLGKAKIQNKNATFWKFHQQRLARLGYPLERKRLNYEYLREIYKFMGEFLRYPKKAVRNVFHNNK